MTGTPDADDGGGPTGPGAPRASDPARRRERPVDRWRRRWLVRAARLRDRARDRAKEWWPKIRPLLRELRWSDQPPPTLTIVDRRVPPPLLVPAQDQMYGFVVRTTFTWSTDLARPELFGWYLDYFQPQASQRLRRIVTRCAREYPPHRPREVEIALDAALTGDDALPWRYQRGDVTFSCEPDVSVHLDERVRRLLQPYWDRRIALECERDLDRQRADYEQERERRSPSPGSGVPGGSGDQHPSQARPGDPPPPTAGQRRQPPRLDSPVEQFSPLEPLLPPPTQRPARQPTPYGSPRSAPAPRGGSPGTGAGSPASPQPGDTASGGREHPDPPDE